MKFTIAKKIFIGLTTVAMTAGIVLGQATTKRNAADKDDPVRSGLIDLEKQSWAAWQKRDGKFFSHFLADDHVELGPGGPTGKTAIVNFVGSPACVVKSYSVDSFKVTIFNPSTALVTYHAVQDTTCGGKPVPSPVWINSLFVKRDNVWVNAAYQQTPENK